MENFAYEEMTSQDVYMVKKTFHEQSNNKQAIDAFNIILKETQIAITNIENVVKSEDELRQLLIKLRNGDVSFAKEVLGLSPKGKNDSCYRAYLAIDKQNIIEVRFANHYETLRAARDKSNNKSQFLFQVVVLTPQTKIKKDSITKPTAVVGNLKVLTNKPLSFSMSNDEELKAALMSIHDYLISPSETFENTKPTITQNNESNTRKDMKQNKKTINEAQLRAIVKEAVSNVLNESFYDDRKPFKAGELKQILSNVDDNDIIAVSISPEYDMFWTFDNVHIRKHSKDDGKDIILTMRK